ncbi:MAG TPA: TonB-dependent receptor [Bacteroidales bacterium]|nr:TonB-dependent receptor [Bacteroidales bacterium]
MKQMVWMVAIVLLAGSSLRAQDSERPSGSLRSMEGSVKGKVMVEGDGPLEYANVVLYRLKDSSLVTGTVTNVDGGFVLEKVPMGMYYAEFNFIGFSKKLQSDIRVTPRNKNQDMGTIYLQEATQQIAGVEVTADRPQVSYKVDKKIINVDQDFSSEGGSAVQVLENIPSIQVDIEGNVEMRGSSSFRVLIDGKPSVLQGSDALQQIPASMIDNIEIITNPSAKYDPEGTAGIINIIMKKKRDPGLNGIVKASLSTNNAYDASANLSYKVNDRINVFTSLNYRDFNFDMTGVSNRENIYQDTTTFIDQSLTNTMERDGYSFQGGIDYQLSQKSSLSFSGRAGNFTFGRGADTRIETYAMPATMHEYEISSSGFDMSHDYYSLNLDFQSKFNEEGHKLDASAYYSFSDNQDLNLREEFSADESWDKLSEDPYKQRTDEDSDEDQLQVKLDYVLPTNSGKLEAGYQGRYDQSNRHYEMQDYTGGQWAILDEFTNTADYSRMIQAIYSTWEGQLWGLDYKLGLRGEYTDRLLEQKALEKNYRIHRFDVFPSAHFSKSFSRGKQMFASYSRRIRRPRSWFIDPFKSYSDRYTVRVGNPGLEPEYTNSYEAGYKTTFGKSFVSLEGYYRETYNQISRIMKLGSNDQMIQTFENLDSESSLGLEAMLNTSLAKWWSMNVSGNLYRYSIEARVNGENITRQSNNWRARVNSTFRLPTGTRLQLMAMYLAPSITAQGEREGFLMTSAAVKQSFMNDKLSLTVSARDLLQSMNHEMISSGPGFRSYNYFEREAPIVQFSLSYTINNYNRQRQRNNQQDQQYEGMEEMF